MAETNGQTTLVKLAARWGLGGMFGGYIVWWLLSSFAAKQDALIAAVKDHDTRMAVVQKHMEDDSERGWIMVGVLQQVCLQGAHTDADRGRCIALKGPSR